MFCGNGKPVHSILGSSLAILHPQLALTGLKQVGALNRSFLQHIRRVILQCPEVREHGLDLVGWGSVVGIRWKSGVNVGV